MKTATRKDLNKLLVYAAERGIIVDLVPGGTAKGTAYIHRNEVKVGKHQSIRQTVYSLAHELGHIETRYNWSKKERDRISDWYLSFKCSGLLSSAVIKHERQAWRLAAKILRKLGILHNPRSFGACAKFALDSYAKPLHFDSDAHNLGGF